ncbi:tRNA (adenosine(37)-N6)-dimethylallyltransferase [Sandaracinobacter neustonicus]|uniref:tRNA (adenosine(37)-N6)-dimethylallyltransferase n=1 Tax=Sandaracinobacter neustonicus TaxID=1715348 RepID=UPI0015E3BFD0|nr:tRNA dimethylallyltransferase [Sandaracinobacter neustonicus]
MPEIPADVRAAVRALSTEQVRDALSAEDALMAARLHANDTQRNARALEVMRATGQSLAQWQAAPPQGGLLGQVELRPLVIDIPRDLLVQRIDRRIEAMWQSGALEEVRRLAARNLSQTLPVMRAIGVPPLLALLRGEVQVAEMIERWRLDTRQYAKRQATWARNQTGGWPRIVTRPI